jgi:hypothetical protein
MQLTTDGSGCGRGIHLSSELLTVLAGATPVAKYKKLNLFASHTPVQRGTPSESLTMRPRFSPINCRSFASHASVQITDTVKLVNLPSSRHLQGSEIALGWP